jgi:hypothetical protein
LLTLRAGREEGNAGSSEMSELGEGILMEEMPEATTSGRRIYLQNLDFNATKDDIMTVLNTRNFATEAIDIPGSKGYAFVDLISPSEAQRAITELQECLILKRKVIVGLQTSMKAPAKPKKKKKTKQTQPSSPEDGEIDEEGQVEKPSVPKWTLHPNEIQAFTSTLKEHAQAVWARHLDFHEIESYARDGQVLVVTAEWPSKKKQKNKRKVIRAEFWKTFYSSIPGQCLVGLYAAQQPLDPSPKGPLRLLFIYDTAASANSARQLLSKVKFTMPPDYEIKLDVLGIPALDLRAIVHPTGDHANPKNIGKIVKWMPTVSLVSDGLRSAITRSVLLKAQTGQVALEGYVVQNTGKIRLLYKRGEFQKSNISVGDVC